MELEKVWRDFFVKADILPEIATRYSVIFRENRITFKMLEDLDRVILREMGIVAVGDIIAILRYAKSYKYENMEVEVNFTLENTNPDKDTLALARQEVAPPSEKTQEKVSVETNKNLCTDVTMMMDNINNKASCLWATAKRKSPLLHDDQRSEKVPKQNLVASTVAKDEKGAVIKTKTVVTTNQEIDKHIVTYCKSLQTNNAKKSIDKSTTLKKTRHPKNVVLPCFNDPDALKPKLSPPLSLKKTEQEVNCVMIYRLDDIQQWAPVGIGRVEFVKGIITCYEYNEEDTSVISDRVIFSSKIGRNTAFETSKETFISWTDLNSEPNTSVSYGLRFKDKLGFTLILNKIRDYLPCKPKMVMNSPIKVKHNAEYRSEANGLSYALASMQGWRPSMEDTHTACLDLKGMKNETSFFAVFDGHGGHRVSFIIAKKLSRQILKQIKSHDYKDYKTALIKGYKKLDKKLEKLSNLKNNFANSCGSTAVSVLIDKHSLYLSNLGDSRALLCSSEGKVIFATEDHKPINASEMKRIYDNDGFVMNRRVNGDLAVSRAFGDFRFKSGSNADNYLVSSTPDVTHFSRSAIFSGGYAILGSDGVFDVLKNEDLAEMVQMKINEGVDLAVICNQILDLCLAKGSRDNMTVLLVKLNKQVSKLNDKILVK